MESTTIEKKRPQSGHRIATVKSKALPSRKAEIRNINFIRNCDCGPTHINCLKAKEWLKCQLGVWQFTYEGRDVRNKKIHPATFPISLAKKVIELFSHQGELILDPFVGSGTMLIASNHLRLNSL